VLPVVIVPGAHVVRAILTVGVNGESVDLAVGELTLDNSVSADVHHPAVSIGLTVHNLSGVELIALAKFSKGNDSRSLLDGSSFLEAFDNTAPSTSQVSSGENISELGVRSSLRNWRLDEAHELGRDGAELALSRDSHGVNDVSVKWGSII